MNSRATVIATTTRQHAINIIRLWTQNTHVAIILNDKHKRNHPMNSRQPIIVRVLYIVAAAIAVVSPLLFKTNTVHADSFIPGTCQSEQLHVPLAADQPADQTINGTLCIPLWWSGHQHEVDILLHGATYNSTYWNWPVETNQYSYVNDTLLAGRATFTYDALGTGASNRPALASSITMNTEAYVLNQVLTWVHSNKSFSRFVVVGHSFGSITAVYEAGLYHDENALVLTGFAHTVNAANAATAVNDLYPANQDPKFAGKNLDSGYWTTVPNTRKALYYGGITDPSVVASDEATKDVVPASAFGQGVAQLEAPAVGNVANKVTVPVLEVIGQKDFLFCGTGAPANCSLPSTVQAYDAPYFSHTSLKVDTIPFTGHDLALHPSNLDTFLKINDWVSSLN
jgi:pimeloyl-ACP methyl ester carboxylesterase